MRDLARLVRSEYLLCRVITASIAGSRSCSSMNSATVMASCGLWPRPPPASTVKPAALTLARGDDAEVVDQALGAIGLAAGEADLDLARHLLVQRVAQEVRHGAVEVRGDIGVLARADAGERAGGDVADGVAAGLARRHAVFRQAAQHGAGLGERHVMQLDVLPRGDVRHLLRHVLVGDVGDGRQPGRIEAAAGQFDAHHVNTLLALTVHALLQAQGGEALGVELQVEVAGERLFVMGDFGCVG